MNNRQTQQSPAQAGDVSFDELSDEQLMLNYRDGQASAFDQLYTRHKAALYRYVLRHTSNQAELANELYQDIWLKIIKSKQQYRHTAKFTTYLYRIAHNHLVDYWRSRKAEFVELKEEHASDSNEQCLPETTLEKQQLSQQIKQQISALPPDQRAALLLKEEASLSLEQIAEVTGVNRETVKSRLRYAVSKLKQSLALIS